MLATTLFPDSAGFCSCRGNRQRVRKITASRIRKLRAIRVQAVGLDVVETRAFSDHLSWIFSMNHSQEILGNP